MKLVQVRPLLRHQDYVVMGSNPMPPLNKRKKKKMEITYWNSTTKFTKFLHLLQIFCALLAFHSFVKELMNGEPRFIAQLFLCFFWLNMIYSDVLNWGLYKLRMVDNPDPDRKFV